MTVLRTRVEADVCFQVDTPGRARVTGSLQGRGSTLTLRVSDPAMFAGGADAAGLRRIAAELADLGVSLQVRDADDVPLVTLGNVRCPWWQRPFTRSPHMRVAGLRGVVSAGRGRLRRDDATLPGPGLLPPLTPFPVAPTFLRRPVRRVTTTHDPGRGGLPRLVEVPGDGITRTGHPVHWLQDDRTTIGSDPGCDIVLPGLAPVHAEVVHDDADEFVVTAVGDAELRVHGRRVATSLLRTSSRIELGPGPRRILAFVREEYADHGRPHGGRIGGELGRQQPQPPRERLQAVPDPDETEEVDR
ncbi:FHA domain-containing protein [Nocardioides sp. P5_C9_2]